MARVVFGIIVAIACPFFWTMILVPLVGRWFGVPIKIGALPIDRRDPRLSKWQSFWFGGVLGWGIGLSLLGVLTLVFIDQRRPSTSDVFIGLVGELAIGVSLSQWSWTYPLDSE